MKNYTNKVILISGSSQGIGHTLGLLYGAMGAKIVLNSRSKEKLELAQETFNKAKIENIAFCGDLSDYQTCLELREFVIEKWGRIDLLINNAAVAIKGDINSSIPDLFFAEQLTNINGSIFPTKVFIEDLKKSNGKILFISSIAGIIGLPEHGIYSASKRAIVSYAETLRNELKEFNVFVGVNYPGFTENSINKTITLPDGNSIVLESREGIRKNTSHKTASKIIEQLEKRKFYGYSSQSGKFLHVLYRLFPVFTLNMIYHKRKAFKTN
jgi:short-subunit dehydrogenase